jgi:Tol biopolymer transport system component
MTIPDADSPTWSPDGKRLAFHNYTLPAVCGSCPKEPDRIYVSDQQGRGRKAVGRSVTTKWSPVSDRILFDGVRRLRLVRPDGSGGGSLGRWSAAEWSPDGSRFLVSIACEPAAFFSRTCVGVVSTRTMRLTRLTTSGEESRGFAWSPDGSKVVWSDYDSATGRRRLMIASPTRAGKVAELVAVPPKFFIDQAVFTQDGKRVLFSTYLVN